VVKDHALKKDVDLELGDEWQIAVQFESLESPLQYLKHVISQLEKVVFNLLPEFESRLTEEVLTESVYQISFI